MRHLMLLPSLNCQDSCSYCFGLHAGGQIMRRETVAALVDWQNALSEDEKLQITFHGGEPLAAGLPFYPMALPLLRDELAPKKVCFTIQSNLWLLRVVEPLLAALTDKDARLRANAAMILGIFPDARAVEPLTCALNDENEEVRSKARKSLEVIKNSKVLQ